MHAVESTRNPAAGAAAVIAAVGAATILGALYFQYALHYQPCPLCLDQRIAYYVGIPLALLTAIAARWGVSAKLLVFGFGVLALAFIANAGLGIYHAGVEWKFWPGPSDCSGATAAFGPASDLMKQLRNIRVVRCDEAAWRFLGLSLAGYNVLISAALAGIALWAMRPVTRPTVGRNVPERRHSSLGCGRGE
jgi:disulfide bond formation protein DsbB